MSDNDNTKPDTQTVAVTLPSPLDPNDPTPTPLYVSAASSLSQPTRSSVASSSVGDVDDALADTKSPLQIGQNLVAGDPVATATSDPSLAVTQDADRSAKPTVPSLTTDATPISWATPVSLSPTASSTRPAGQADDTLTIETPSSSQEEVTLSPSSLPSPAETSSSAPPTPPPPPAATSATQIAVAIDEQEPDSISSTLSDVATLQPSQPPSATAQIPPSPTLVPASTSTREAQKFDSLDLVHSSTYDISESLTASASSSTSKGLHADGGVMALDLGESSSSSRASNHPSSVASVTGGPSKTVDDKLKDVSPSSGASGSNKTATNPAGSPSSGIESQGSKLAAANSDTAGTSLASSTASGQANQAESKAETKSEDQGGKLSSIAIVGIVGGVLLALILIYLAWYRWRKRRARHALQELPDDDEKFSPRMHDNRITRSSFGAAEPITPYNARDGRYRRRSEESFGYDEDDNDIYSKGDDYDEDWYDPDHRIAHGSGHDHRHRGTFDDPRTAPIPPDTGVLSHGRTGYDLDQYGDGMTAALADGLSTAAPENSRSLPAENPFVPPVPPLPTSYSHSKHETIRTLPAVPDDVDPDAGYGVSIYDSYGNQPQTAISRPQTDIVEPSTSNLLPWLNKGNNNAAAAAAAPPPPVPPLPEPVPVDQDGQEMFTEPPRAPPRAMMAQTPIRGAPVGHGGELGAAPIPTFR
ncbi:hypothetical protein I316_03237 [Kwoniella heveanensis BCC8398]|uniref:Uncharacterized protein n=1 Tax=Kwoniella heveanensis BCC8398 TaxID=1296120 RepID=A0A1B9GVY1_9TREE|nr:hypothetical protein I316_03237 [Kwoniella heveanensis BCC8398]